MPAGNNKVSKAAPTLSSLAPSSIDGRLWVGTLKEQLMSSKDGEVTNAELVYFATVSKSTGLDPAKREIYAIFRNVKQKDGTYKPKMSIQTGIDGFRVAAERSGQFGGSKEPEFVYEPDTKITVNYSGTQKVVPNTAKVTVYKVFKDRVIETTRTANWADFYPGDQQAALWRKFPEVMLAKCAEAQALRAAFPNLGQLYLAEEMEGPEPEEAGTTTDLNAAKGSIKNAKDLGQLMEIMNGLPVDAQKQLTDLATARSNELMEQEDAGSEQD
jgi:phage recombination protein Bet